MTVRIRETNTFSGVPERELDADFPKAYASFYQTKYELSQQEYCDFLNTLTPRQQRARDICSQIKWRSCKSRSDVLQCYGNGGNLQEPVVTVGHPSGREYEGTHGDGRLSEQGTATN